MAQYKVPQNVEADDKLLGPFSFRQFIYLLVAAGGIALAVALFQIFPLLAIIPLPVVFFFAILALPLKKDQPMETYLAAIVSFYTKPRMRLWKPGQRESTIQITTPKKVEEPRTRNISQEEAGHRLSFLADVVDSGGQAVNQPMRDDLRAEAEAIPDMFDENSSFSLNQQLDKSADRNHTEALNQMRAAIQEREEAQQMAPQTSHVIPEPQPTPPLNTAQEFNNLANENPDLSISTLQKEADRRQQKNNNEVYVSLH